MRVNLSRSVGEDGAGIPAHHPEEDSVGTEAKSIKVRVPVELGSDFVSDVLITAFDSGYGSCRRWAKLLDTDVQESEDEGDLLWTSSRVTIKEDFYHLLESGHTALLREKELVVDASAIGKGIQFILYGCDSVPPDHEIHRDILSSVLARDAGDIDAGCADVIVQMGMFGRVLF